MQCRVHLRLPWSLHDVHYAYYLLGNDNYSECVVGLKWFQVVDYNIIIIE